MDNRLNRFWENDMNVEQMKDFRQEIEGMDEEDIDNLLDSHISDFDCNEDCSDSLHDRLMHNISVPKKSFIQRYLLVAVAVLIPILVVISIYFYMKAEDYSRYDAVLSQKISISTSRGEKVTTVLPDGSKVIMGPLSSLCYQLSSFNEEQRIVEWSGEGYFNIKKYDHLPFHLLAAFFKINVTGTTFSILTTNSQDATEIYLEEGAISLSTSASKVAVNMSPGDMALVKHSDGSITILKDDEQHSTTFTENIIMFNSDLLSTVADRLSVYYDLDFGLTPEMATYKFTGALPTDNLAEALYILEKSFDLKALREDNKIIFKK